MSNCTDTIEQLNGLMLEWQLTCNIRVSCTSFTCCQNGTP